MTITGVDTRSALPVWTTREFDAHFLRFPCLQGHWYGDIRSLDVPIVSKHVKLQSFPSPEVHKAEFQWVEQMQTADTSRDHRIRSKQPPNADKVPR